MTRNIEGKKQNVKASLEKYIHDNIVLTEGIKVSFEGFPFEINDNKEWINEYIDKFGDVDYHRGVSSGVDGQTVSLLVSFTIYVVKETTNKTNRHYEIRDILADYFSIGDTIPMYDFSNDNFNDIIQYMKVRNIDVDEPLLDERKFYVYNYSVIIDWLEKW